jgi:hypothetical protein
MTETVFCESCGKPVAADAKFCEHCGATLSSGARAGSDPLTASNAGQGSNPRAGFDPGAGAGGAGYESQLGSATPEGQARQSFIPPQAAAQAAERIEALTPGATELASQLFEQIRTPVVATALAAGSLAAAAVFAIGVVLGLVFSDQSLLGAVDAGKGAITAGFAQMLNFLQVGYSGNVGKLGPALFLVFPIGACAVAARAQAGRTRGLQPSVRLASGVGVGVVFGLLMLIPALAAGNFGGGEAGSSISPDALGAVLLGILWGSIGGLLGTYYVVRRELEPGFLRKLAPPVVGDVGQTIFVALRPLALGLLVMTVLGTATWTVETLLKSDVREERSTLVATVDDAAYGIEHGLHWTELGGLAEFKSEGGDTVELPVPVGDPFKVKTSSKGQYRLFGFNAAMPAYTFIPLLILLIGIPLLLALNAGFAVARLRRPPKAWLGAAWGCLVGPIWALSMVILNALIAKDFFGRAVGDSVFGSFLLGGLVVGAIGGLLSVQSSGSGAWSAATPSAPGSSG